MSSKPASLPTAKPLRETYLVGGLLGLLTSVSFLVAVVPAVWFSELFVTPQAHARVAAGCLGLLAGLVALGYIRGWGCQRGWHCWIAHPEQPATRVCPRCGALRFEVQAGDHIQVADTLVTYDEEAV